MLFLLFPQTLTQGVIHNMNDSSGESLIQIKNLTAAVRIYKYNETPKFAHFTSGLIKDTI